LNQRLEVQQQERKRIAQELHDTLLQGFTGISLKLEAMATRPPESTEAVNETLHAILDDSDRYLAEARRAVWALRSPSFAEGRDFAATLSHSCWLQLENTGIAYDFSVSGTPRPLDARTEENLLRIAQEATANAVKHAAPEKFSVRLAFQENTMQLKLKDDGRGFDPAQAEKKTGHFGLTGMRERVEALGGTVAVLSESGQGTEIVATIKSNGHRRPD
jgi:signal transduction histidine kinase